MANGEIKYARIADLAKIVFCVERETINQTISTNMFVIAA